MCQYSSENGALNDFHIAHYGSFALKGAGMIIIEASAVEPRGRITPDDAGIWSDEHIAPLKRVVDIIKSQGSVAALQIAHAGRKGSVTSPFTFEAEQLVPKEQGGWGDDLFAPSAIAHNKLFGTPKVMTVKGIEQVTQHFIDAAVRADKAGIDVLEIHSAHGFLLHSFLSGNSNKRTDIYGGSLENRLRFPLAVAKGIRDVWPAHKPLWVRLSASDHKNSDGGIAGGVDEDGWDVTQASVYARELKKIGVDVIDVSSGGSLTNVDYQVGPLYQVPLSEYIKKEADVATGTVGIITEPKDAEEILQKGQADYILVAREFLRNSGWVNRASKELGVQIKWPKQYVRADRERYFRSIANSDSSK